MVDDNRSGQEPAIPPAHRLTPEELNRRNPNPDAFWQAREMKKRPKDWQQRIAREKAAKAKRLQQEQKAAARAARSQRSPGRVVQRTMQVWPPPKARINLEVQGQSLAPQSQSPRPQALTTRARTPFPT